MKGYKGGGRAEVDGVERDRVMLEEENGGDAG